MSKNRDTIRSHKAHEYAKDFALVGSLAYHWRQIRPESDEIKALVLALGDMHRYTQSLEADVQALEDLLNDNLKREN